MTDATALFAQAVAGHRAGRLGSAVQDYRAFLATTPEHVRARHLLGFALLQIGAWSEAEEELLKAVRRAPGMTDAWTHLGLARLQIDSTLAGVALHRALLLAPAHLEAVEAALRASGGAVQHSRERIARWATVLGPGRPAGWHALGVARVRQATDAGAPPPADVVRCFRRALVLTPQDIPASTDLANTLRLLREPDPARRVAQQAICLRPRSAVPWWTLAAALFDLDGITEADRAARAAAILEPGRANGYGNRAQCLYRLGCFAEAIRDGSRAALIAPRDPQILANLGTYHLGAGNVAAGWQLFRHRIGRRLIDGSPHLPGPHWNGEPGARLLALAEQGLGDEILFASCWPDLAQAVRDGRLAAVRIELDPRLRPLAARSFPELDWVDRDRTAGPADGIRRSADFGATHYVAAGDLPGLFRPSPGTFPEHAGYLRPDPRRVAEFRRWLDAEAPGRRRLGLCWRSGLRTADRVKYYPGLADCRPLLSMAGCRIVVLQYDDFAEELTTLTDSERASLLVPPGLDLRDDQDGVAALLLALDRVISAETAVLALAGAVGAPTVGFGLGPGWTALGLERSPWYPSVGTVYRRPDESWEALMARLAGQAATIA